MGSKPKSGILGGVEWSEEEGKEDLYAFAREHDLPITSKSKKAEIVAELVKATRREARAKSAAVIEAVSGASTRTSTARPDDNAAEMRRLSTRPRRRRPRPSRPSRPRNMPTGGARKVR